MHVRKVVAGAAVAFSLACGAATAAPITGEVAINFGQVTDGGGPLTGATTLNISNARFTSSGLGTLVILAGTAIDNFSVSLSVGSPVVFTSAGGDYVGEVSSVDFFFSGSFANVVSVAGTFTPDPLFEKPAGSFPFSGLGPNPETQVNLTFTFTPSSAGGGSYAGGGVMTAAAPTIPENIPEPLSLGLFGLGLAGLGLAARRRGKAAPAA